MTNPTFEHIIETKIYEYVFPEDLPEVQRAFEDSLQTINDPYSDNFGVFPLDLEEYFEEQISKGCCGRYNSSITCKSGRTYFYGFNYGH